MESGQWFDFDVNVDKNRFDWYKRLDAVATKLVIQYILIKCEFAQPGGHVVLDPSTSAVQSLLLQVPTDSVEDTFPPFRMDTASIREWVEFSEQNSKIP